MPCYKCKVRDPAPGKRRCLECISHANQLEKDRRRLKAKLGICVSCRDSAEPGKRMCQKHLNKAAQTDRRWREIWTSAGLCTYCGKDPVPGFRSCQSHLSRSRAHDLKARPRKKQYARQYARTEQGRYVNAIRTAKTKGLVWDLEKTEYLQLIKLPCYYCGDTRTPEVSIGLDRLDSAKGYVKDNVVSCCVECNVAKSDRFSVEEMKVIGEAIAKVKRLRYGC